MDIDISSKDAVPSAELPDWKEKTKAVILSQGAEAIIYKATFCGTEAIIKERFPKKYRHPTLDEKINNWRVKEEGRVLVRARQAGVDVPTLYLMDKIRMLLFFEFIDGPTVKTWLLSQASNEQNDYPTTTFHDNSHSDSMREDRNVDTKALRKEVAFKIGKSIASLHKANLIHGDLTTSNFLLRNSDQSVVMIDFGLSSSSSGTEERAVDLYVLERAFLSTHTDLSDMFQHILDSYTSFGFEEVIRKLDEVRLRGRKKIAFG